jgi:thioredoxin 1
MPDTKPLELTADNFDKTIGAGKPVFVDFWAPWCGPCQIMLPIVDELAQNYKNKDKVVFGTVNIDDNPEIAAKFNVMSVPTLLIFKDGKVSNSMIGVTPSDQIEKALEQVL